MAQYLSNLPVGAKVKFGHYDLSGMSDGIAVPWVIVAKNHTGYPSNSVTLLADKLIALFCLDAKEPNNSRQNRKNYGNNRYRYSNLDQWLNASAQSWYSAQHEYDQAPDTSDRCGGYGTQYSQKTGFLFDFSEKERSAILSTTIRVAAMSSYDGVAQEDITRKVFLPSLTEVGVGVLSDSAPTVEGAKWAYFGDAASRVCTAHPKTIQWTSSSVKPSSTTQAWAWWTRTPYNGKSDLVHYSHSIMEEGQAESFWACSGEKGVRPALNLSSTALVSDTTDSEGYYTVVFNNAPATSTVSVPTTVYGGKTSAISWTAAADPDVGDTVTYVLECAYDGGAFSQIYSGTALSYSHLVTFGVSTVQYRIKVVDKWGAASAYTTSASRTVINNNAPTISGSDANLGIKTEGFSIAYTVNDLNNDVVTVTEKLDGASVRSYAVTLGAENKFMVTAETWLKLANGVHTLTISAVDRYNEVATRTYTFTKNITSFSIQNSTPMAADTMPTYILLTVTRSIPEGAIFKVEVCNNGFDASPTWEDATDSVIDQYMFSFTNQVKVAAEWGVSVRITVDRNGSDGACYVSEIGGNFE